MGSSRLLLLLILFLVKLGSLFNQCSKKHPAGKSGEIDGAINTWLVCMFFCLAVVDHKTSRPFKKQNLSNSLLTNGACQQCSGAQPSFRICSLAVVLPQITVLGISPFSHPNVGVSQHPVVGLRLEPTACSGNEILWRLGYWGAQDLSALKEGTENSKCNKKPIRKARLCLFLPNPLEMCPCAVRQCGRRWQDGAVLVRGAQEPGPAVLCENSLLLSLAWKTEATFICPPLREEELDSCKRINWCRETPNLFLFSFLTAQLYCITKGGREGIKLQRREICTVCWPGNLLYTFI